MLLSWNIFFPTNAAHSRACVSPCYLLSRIKQETKRVVARKTKPEPTIEQIEGSFLYPFLYSIKTRDTTSMTTGETHFCAHLYTTTPLPSTSVLHVICRPGCSGGRARGGGWFATSFIYSKRVLVLTSAYLCCRGSFGSDSSTPKMECNYCAALAIGVDALTLLL